MRVILLVRLGTVRLGRWFAICLVSPFHVTWHCDGVNVLGRIVCTPLQVSGTEERCSAHGYRAVVFAVEDGSLGDGGRLGWGD
jgi:hypothetical protein